MKKDENENIIKPNEQISQIKINIKDEMNNSYLELIKNKQYINVNDLDEWKNTILSKIYLQIDKLNDYKIKNSETIITNDNKNKTEIKIESKNELNCFTSKDIQEENKEITRNFQNETYNYMNINEKVENDIAAFFLKDVARISRIAYNEGKNVLKIMKEKYIHLKNEKNKIEKEIFNKEFSSWVKKLEKEKNIKEYENILNQVNLFQKKETIKNQEFLSKLFYDLSIMYFHCNISFPSVEINFKSEEDFDSEKMIDFINRGKNRKVNFVILPSLMSNGNYLQNGKSWVFTFTKNTFKFDDSIKKYLKDLLKKDKIEDLDRKNINDNLVMTVYCEEKNDKLNIKINTNIDLPKNREYEFVFHAINKNNNKTSLFKTKKKSLKIDKAFVIDKYEFILDQKVLISSKEVIYNI